jgi:hypothetical protein
MNPISHPHPAPLRECVHNLHLWFCHPPGLCRPLGRDQSLNHARLRNLHGSDHHPQSRKPKHNKDSLCVQNSLPCPKRRTLLDLH